MYVVQQWQLAYFFQMRCQRESWLQVRSVLPVVPDTPISTPEVPDLSRSPAICEFPQLFQKEENEAIPAVPASFVQVPALHVNSLPTLFHPHFFLSSRLHHIHRASPYPLPVSLLLRGLQNRVKIANHSMYCLRHFLPMYTRSLPFMGVDWFMIDYFYRHLRLRILSCFSWYLLHLRIARGNHAHAPSFDICCGLNNVDCSIYCSVILITLFSTSCYWSDRCLLDLNNGNIFTARVPADNRSMGMGTGWLRGLMGNKTWRLPCVGVRVVAWGLIQ